MQIGLGSINFQIEDPMQVLWIIRTSVWTVFFCADDLKTLRSSVLKDLIVVSSPQSEKISWTSIEWSELQFEYFFCTAQKSDDLKTVLGSVLTDMIIASLCQSEIILD